jgi:hypothetical protein
VKTIGVVLGAVMLVVAVACGDDGADASATLACGHFRNVARDQTDGLLTRSELRGKLAEVERDARFSEEPGIARAARDMVAAATAGDDAALAEAVTRFGSACESAGV